MRLHATLLVLSGALGACVSHPPAPPSRAAAATPAAALAEQAAAQAAATRPGREHRALDPLVGAWITSNAAVDEQGRESDAVPGKAAIGWTLGGRYLRLDASLSLPNGTTHTSSGFLGYDQASGEHQWLMVSDLSTGMGVARGRGDVSRGGLRFVLDVVDPRSGITARATSVLRALGPDHLVLEQIGVDPSGLERVLRRTHYRRAEGTTLAR
jgi:hypothetical protein